MDQHTSNIDDNDQASLYADNQEENSSIDNRVPYENQLADPEMDRLFLNEEPVRMNAIDNFIKLIIRALGVQWESLSLDIQSQLTVSIEKELYALIHFSGNRLMQLLQKESYTIGQRNFDIKWDIFKVLSSCIKAESKQRASSKEQIDQIKNKLLLLDRTDSRSDSRSAVVASNHGLGQRMLHEQRNNKRVLSGEGDNTIQKKLKENTSCNRSDNEIKKLQPGHLLLFLVSSTFHCKICNSESIQGDHIVILSCCRYHLCQNCLDYLALQQMTAPKRSCPFCHAFSPLSLRIGLSPSEGNDHIDLSDARNFTYDITKF